MWGQPPSAVLGVKLEALPIPGLTTRVELRLLLPSPPLVSEAR